MNPDFPNRDYSSDYNKSSFGRPSNEPVVWYSDFPYQADSWDRPRRVVAKIEHHKGESFPRVGFIVTNLRRSAQGVVKFYKRLLLG